MKIQSITIIFLMIFTFACQNQDNVEKMGEKLFQADIEFSNLSKNQGRNAAFQAYCADDAIMLAPNTMPIEGKTDIVSRLFLHTDSTYTLTWHPVNSFVAQSGELGYTYGLWNLETSDSTGKKINEQGTYITVWKKDKYGNWKFALDSGNEGLSQ